MTTPCPLYGIGHWGPEELSDLPPNREVIYDWLTMGCPDKLSSLGCLIMSSPSLRVVKYKVDGHMAVILKKRSIVKYTDEFLFYKGRNGLRASKWPIQGLNAINGPAGRSVQWTWTQAGLAPESLFQWIQSLLRGGEELKQTVNKLTSKEAKNNDKHSW